MILTIASSLTCYLIGIASQPAQLGPRQRLRFLLFVGLAVLIVGVVIYLLMHHHHPAPLSARAAISRGILEAINARPKLGLPLSR